MSRFAGNDSFTDKLAKFQIKKSTLLGDADLDIGTGKASPTPGTLETFLKIADYAGWAAMLVPGGQPEAGAVTAITAAAKEACLSTFERKIAEGATVAVVKQEAQQAARIAAESEIRTQVGSRIGQPIIDDAAKTATEAAKIVDTSFPSNTGGVAEAAKAQIDSGIGKISETAKSIEAAKLAGRAETAEVVTPGGTGRAAATETANFGRIATGDALTRVATSNPIAPVATSFSRAEAPAFAGAVAPTASTASKLQSAAESLASSRPGAIYSPERGLVIPRDAPERGIYDILRPKTPSSSLRSSTDALQGKMRPKVGDIDGAYTSSGRTIGETSGGLSKVSPDHVISLAEMVGMPGFAKLSPRDMYRMMNWRANLQWLSRPANSAKRSRVAADVKGWDPSFRDAQTVLELRNRDSIQAMIYSLLSHPERLDG
ncbi:hypothetical protein [Tsukamurella spumae]|uniref:Uncharacterized protein n=1 Tax=Tsukamurella spumae TaxID=44753 RepID=A0A846X228_9ACTN|nr:hypothetical protein [Tsukamurella spumae]NKY19667.1 hypothetical protein [Tsukamurella spumae]